MSVHPSSKTDIQKACSKMSKPLKPCIAIELDRPLPEHIVLSWCVSRNAFAQIAPVGPSATIQLELRLTPNQRAQWVLIDPKTNAELAVDLPSAQAPIAITQTTTGLHLESPDLRAHLQSTDADSYELLYIRTTIFTQLHIPGGRYEPAGVRVNTTT